MKLFALLILFILASCNGAGGGGGVTDGPNPYKDTNSSGSSPSSM